MVTVLKLIAAGNESRTRVAHLGLNPIRVLKTSSRLTLINGAGTCLNFMAVALVANRMGPDLFGRISLVLLWVSYAGLLHPGIFEGGQRQLINFLGKGNLSQARHAQNVGLSGEFIWAFLPAAVLAVAGARSPDPVLRFGFMLAPVMYAGVAITRILGGLFMAYQKFQVYMVASLLRSLVQPGLLIVLTYRAGPYALVAAPAIVEVGIAVYYFSQARELGIRWQMERLAAIDLLRIGFPLSVAVIVYWAYRLAGPTSVGAWLPSAALGGYMIASKLIDLMARCFGDFSGILMPSLWSALGRTGGAQALWREISHINLFLTISSCILCNLLQAVIAFPAFVFLPRFSSSVAIVEVLAFNIVLLAAAMPSSLLLDSAVINRQWLHLSIWSFALVLNYGVNYAVLRAGYGVIAIAWNDIWVQLVVVLFICAAVHGDLFPSFALARRLYLSLLALLLMCVGVYSILSAPVLSETPNMLGHVLLIKTLARVGVVIVMWTLTGALLYRAHPSFAASLLGAHQTGSPA